MSLRELYKDRYAKSSENRSMLIRSAESEKDPDTRSKLFKEAQQAEREMIFSDAVRVLVINKEWDKLFWAFQICVCIGFPPYIAVVWYMHHASQKEIALEIKLLEHKYQVEG
ncbi:hypothetical protein [Vibrio bathopelagicus]